MIELEGKKYLCEKEAANIIGLSASWLRAKRSREEGPSHIRFTKCGKIFYEETALKNWISKRIIHY